MLFACDIGIFNYDSEKNSAVATDELTVFCFAS